MPPRPTPTGLFSASQTAPTPTGAGWITAHCDGGARGNPGPAGYGAEVTDAQGNVVAELSEFLGIRTNNYAEYSGLLASLQFALDNHFPRLKVISDSELMVKQIQGKYKVNSPDLKPLWQEAKSRIARLEGFEITHALRHKNKAADALANQAMDRGMRRGPAPTSPSPQSRATPSAAPTQPAQPIIQRANPYPAKSEAPPDPYPSAAPASKADAMLRGFTRDGVVHILGGATLPDGIFVKIIRE
ncbi:ribonuclease HI family protein [Granulicella sp. dw_53]|uniref:ribonuclease HI family protein n=1 Tax=Granulicella sp. dw_53 TaxID=2719792 RepID=UPI001BD4EFC1|nr:ribonuclease HI family protein [Granulicella sp. dw_53]